MIYLNDKWLQNVIDYIYCFDANKTNTSWYYFYNLYFQNLKFLFFSKSIYDDFRYVNFSRSNVDVGADFNIRDGIFRVPVSGLDFV